LVTAAHQQLTMEWWQGRRASFTLFVSELVLAEAGAGDAEIAARRLACLTDIPSLAITPEAQSLAGRLLAAGVLPAKAAADALHLAIAAAHRVDYLLTWNIRHLANAAIRRQVERITVEAGLVAPVLCTPEELMEG
jgi:predicted nucleic acid-binding protein